MIFKQTDAKWAISNFSRQLFLAPGYVVALMTSRMSKHLSRLSKSAREVEKSKLEIF